MTPEVEAALTTPIVAAAAVGALVLLVAAWPAVGALLTAAHEAGHVAVGVLTGHRVLFFEVANEDAGHTVLGGEGLGPGRILTTFAGYVTPRSSDSVARRSSTRARSCALLWAAAGLWKGAELMAP